MVAVGTGTRCPFVIEAIESSGSDRAALGGYRMEKRTDRALVAELT